MEIKKETSLGTTANKIGCTILLSYLSYGLILKFVEKFLNFEVLIPTTIAWFIAFLIPSLFLLEVNFKEIFTRKVKETNLGFKRYLLLTVFFIMFDRLFTLGYAYVIGYHKLQHAVSSTFDSLRIPSNMLLATISIFIQVVCEEIVYRGIILENLRKYGDVFAIVVCGILFGVSHYQLIILKSMTGVILSIFYVLGGNLKWPILVHFIINMGSVIPEIFRNTIALQFPQVTDSQAYLVLIVFIFIVMIISLLFCIKDEILKPLFQRWSIKNILKQFKQDKGSYKEFFSASAVAFSLAIELCIVLGAFVKRLNIYF